MPKFKVYKICDNSDYMDIKEKLEENSREIDKIIEKYIPRKYSNEMLEFTLGKARYKYDDSATDFISKPVWDLLDRGGKRWRPALCMMIGEAFGQKDIIDIAMMIEVIHNGSLVVDDIEDKGELRRGEPCVHKKFGDDVAINAGNAMYFLPLLAFLKNKDKWNKEIILKAYETYSQEMINIHFGQGMDIIWHNGKDNVTEEEYLQMCAYKTGTLARMAAKFGAIFAGQDDNIIEKIGRLAESLGIGFQIQDDILDIISSGDERDKFGKSFGNDVTEGKRTLMVIHALEKADDIDKKKMLEILDSHTTEEDKIKEFISLLVKYGAVEYAKEKAKVIVKEAWDEVKDEIPENKAKEDIEEMINFCIERKW